MIRNKNQLEEILNGWVNFGDNNQVSIVRKGSIAFKAMIGKIMHMHDTLYVLGLKHTLLSIGQLCLKNYKVIFEKRSCKITNETNRQVVATILMYEKRMYMLKMQLVAIKCLKTTLDPIWMLHKKLGHLNFNSLCGLHKLVKGMLTFSNLFDTFCERCIFGKQHREKFLHHQHHS